MACGQTAASSVSSGIALWDTRVSAIDWLVHFVRSYVASPQTQSEPNVFLISCEEPLTKHE